MNSRDDRAEPCLQWEFREGVALLFIRPTEGIFPVRSRDQRGRASIYEISGLGFHGWD